MVLIYDGENHAIGVAPFGIGDRVRLTWGGAGSFQSGRIVGLVPGGYVNVRLDRASRLVSVDAARLRVDTRAGQRGQQRAALGVSGGRG